VELPPQLSMVSVLRCHSSPFRRANMPWDLRSQLWIFDAGDDAGLATALGPNLDIDCEDLLE
jgi:hypothetical protein